MSVARRAKKSIALLTGLTLLAGACGGSPSLEIGPRPPGRTHGSRDAGPLAPDGAPFPEDPRTDYGGGEPVEADPQEPDAGPGDPVEPPEGGEDAGPAADGGPAEPEDAGEGGADAGSSTEPEDGGFAPDAGLSDAGPPDAGLADPGASDAGEADAGEADAGPGSLGPRRIRLLDAAFDRGNGKLYFFRGAEYIRYDWALDRADPGYPKSIATYWPGNFPRDLDAAFASDGKVHFFRGAEYVRFDLALDRADPGYPVAIAQAWPGLFERVDAALPYGGRKVRFVRGAEFLDWDLDAHAPIAPGVRSIAADWPGVWPDGMDAALSTSPTRSYLFRGKDYLRFDWANGAVDPGYPRLTACWWPGLWNPFEGTGEPGENLPPEVAALLAEVPSAEEIAARKARVAASITSGWVDRSPDYPLYLASVEKRLGAYGCLLLQQSGTDTWRFRCASDTSGVRALAIPRLMISHIDWRRAAYHTEQVSQGDFMARAGTPISILRSDDGFFRVVGVYGDPPTGSISGGTRVRVRFKAGGVDKDFQFSHLNTQVPAYVLEARDRGTPLSVGTAVGFIGYTGNLWIAAPPPADQPYAGNGAGLPDAHTHVWFVNQPENHQALAPFAREALTYCGPYPYGGG